MTCLAAIGSNSAVSRIDPRVRFLTALWLAACTAVVRNPPAVGFALAAGLALVAAARIPPRRVIRRLVPLNIFMLLVLLTLPWTVPGRPLLNIGPAVLTAEGLQRALLLAARGNALMLMMIALLGTMEVTDIAHALSRLHLPARLVGLFIITIRYIEVLHHHEFDRLARAMKSRSFRPRADLHTYRSYGYLLGMFMVRSFERAERILRAMKSRGFDGRLPALEAPPLRPADIAFAVSTAFAGIIMLGGLLP